ncbi:response regulator [Novosphingobium rosa]|uniref:response regulator n=1 Tax=Novosphingobium rosa TaxID=76978 RepID=UPI00082E1600|nr:response regulator [Novosphingobium rosa]
MPKEALKTTVLVVEDEILVRLYGMDILEDAGFSVLEAGNADEAINLLQEHDHVNLLFSDIDMPGSMNGLELAKFVRDRWPSIKLLLTSGHRHPAPEELPDEGRFVRKPWREDALMEKIRAMLA